jgi:cation diffusion facilitator family transporter
MLTENGDQRSAASRKVTLTSIAVNILLSIGQIALGVIGNSQALIADGIHTLSDLSTDSLVLYAIWHGNKEADEDHPYGHGRIETAATVFLGIILAMVGIGIAVNAALRLMDPASIQVPEVVTLFMAIITIVSKEGLYRYTIHVARRYQSAILRANAWHHRSDAISSIIVLIGIGGSLLGLPFFDALAAIGLATMIIRMGVVLSWNALKELIDTALEQEEVDAIRHAIGEVDGVIGMHMLRSRLMGGRALVDVHLQVDGNISVSEGHQISENVRTSLIDQFESVDEVLVHIDPEDDQVNETNIDLPLRTEMTQRIKDAIARLPDSVLPEKVTLHYLSGSIDIDLVLPMKANMTDSKRRQLTQRIIETLQQDKHVGQVDIFFHCAH